MATILSNPWFYVVLCFTVFLLTTAWLTAIARHFYTQSFTRLPFSIFDLEFALSEAQLVKLIEQTEEGVKKKLRLHLRVDFLFMAAVYPGIALLCYITAQKMEYGGRYLFLALAALQALPLLFDIIENGYLLRKLRRPVTSDGPVSFSVYQFLVKAKFAIALPGIVCAGSALLFFWLTGNYAYATLGYLGLMAAEVALALLLRRAVRPKSGAAAGA